MRQVGQMGVKIWFQNRFKKDLFWPPSMTQKLNSNSLNFLYYNQTLAWAKATYSEHKGCPTSSTPSPSSQRGGYRTVQGVSCFTYLQHGLWHLLKKNNNSCIVHKGSHGIHVKIHSLHSKSRQTRFSISHFYSHIYSEITWWGIFINIKSNLAANMLISLSIRKTKHGNNANQKCM